MVPLPRGSSRCSRSSQNTLVVILKFLQGVHEKIVFLHNSLQPLPRLRDFKALNAMRVYSHSYWLVIFLYNQ